VTVARDGQKPGKDLTNTNPLAGVNTLISAAVQDTHTTVEDFGDGPGGMLDVVRR
jgi:hypothetical protein